MVFVKVISKPFCALLLRWVGGLLFLMLAQSACAVTWLQQISVPVALDYDTNARMVSTDAKSIWRSKISPNYSLTGVQDLNQWYADAALLVERTSDQSVSLNREDPSFNVGWRRQMETGQFGIRLHYDETSSRVSQLDETGQSGGDTTRVSRSIGIDWQKSLSEKVSLATNAEAKKLTFNGGGSPDSKSYSASAMLTYLWTESVEPYLQLAANRHAPESATPATNLFSAVVGAKWTANERLESNVYVGMNKVSGVTQDIGWRAGVDTRYQQEKSKLSATLSRSVSPAGNGGFIESDMLKGGWEYEVSDRSQAGLDVSMRKNHDSNNSETQRVSIWYGRELTNLWSLRASIMRKSSSSSVKDASGNVLGLSLVYTPPSF